MVYATGVRVLAAVSLALAFAAVTQARGDEPEPPEAERSALLVFAEAGLLGYTPRAVTVPDSNWYLYVKNNSPLGGIYFTMTRVRRGRVHVVSSVPIGKGEQRLFIVQGREGDHFYVRSAFVPGRFEIHFVAPSGDAPPTD